MEVERVARLEGWEVNTREGIASLVMRESEDEEAEEEREGRGEEYSDVLVKPLSEEESE